MKKQIAAKLSVAKSTISHLNVPEMDQVKGGYITASCPDFGCATNYRCTTGCPSVKIIYCP